MSQSSDDSPFARVDAEARQLHAQAGYAEDEVPDIREVVRRIPVRLEDGRYVDDPCSEHGPNHLVVDERLARNLVLHTLAILHGLGHLLLRRAKVFAAQIWPSLPGDLPKHVEELWALHNARRLAAPPLALIAWMFANPKADAFDGARFFDMNVHDFIHRVLEAICSPFTSDPRCDKPILRRLVHRFVSRVHIVGTKRIAEFKDRDTRNEPNEIVNPEIRSLITKVVKYTSRPSNASARAILNVFRELSSPTLRALIEHTRLEITDMMFKILDRLPEADARQARATAYLKLGYPETAREELGDVESMTGPTKANALALLARIEKLRRTPDGYRAAVAHCLAALEIDPENVEARMNLVNAYIALDRLGDAKEELEKMIEDPRAMYFVGKLCEVREDLPHAIAAYRYVLQDSENPMARKSLSRLASLFERIDEISSAFYWSVFFQRFPIDALGLAHHARYCQRTGQIDAVVRTSLKAIQIAPTAAWSYRMLAEIYGDAGAPDLARGFRRQADLLEEALLAKPTRAA